MRIMKEIEHWLNYPRMVEPLKDDNEASKPKSGYLPKYHIKPII